MLYQLLGMLALVALYVTPVHAADHPVTVAGITLGAPLTLPECSGSPSTIPLIHRNYDFPPKNAPCWEMLLPKMPHLRFIEYPERPPLGVHMSVDVYQGRAEVVTFRTAGLADQELTLNKLEDKFGKPETVSHRPVQNSFGTEYDRITVTWRLGGGVIVSFMNIANRTNDGFVAISTVEGRRRGEEELRGHVKAEPRL